MKYLVNAPLFVWLAVVASVGLVVGSMALGASTSTVTATVTAQNISVSVSPGSISYGTVAVSSQNSTTPGQANAQQIATNNGNIAETFNVQGTNSAAWTLAASPGSEQYRHRFSTSGVSSWTWTDLTTSYQTAASNISANATKPFDFWVWTPSSTASFASQNVNVTIQAVTFP